MNDPQTTDNGLSFRVTKDANGNHDVWLNFKASTGRSASISIAAYAENKGHIIGKALREWADDVIEKHYAAAIQEEDRQREIDDNSQFGVGA